MDGGVEPDGLRSFKGNWQKSSIAMRMNRRRDFNKERLKEGNLKEIKMPVDMHGETMLHNCITLVIHLCISHRSSASDKRQHQETTCCIHIAPGDAIEKIYLTKSDFHLSQPLPKPNPPDQSPACTVLYTQMAWTSTQNRVSSDRYLSSLSILPWIHSTALI